MWKHIYGNNLRYNWEWCVKERYPHSKANIRLVQHCAAISATAELVWLLLITVVNFDSTGKVVVVKLMVRRPHARRGEAGERWAEERQTDGRATVWPAASRRIDRRPGHRKPTAPARSAGDLVYRRETGNQATASERASVADTNANRRAIHHGRSARHRTRFSIVWRCGSEDLVRTETLGYSRLLNALNIQAIHSRIWLPL